MTTPIHNNPMPKTPSPSMGEGWSECDPSKTPSPLMGEGRGEGDPSTSQSTDLLTNPSPAELSALREMMLHCIHDFPTYRNIFQNAGITHKDIESADPLHILRNLPTIGAAELNRISMESVAATDTIVDTETSSGTTSGGKIRFISYEDDATEHRFLARLLRICGVGPEDRVACLDTDPAAVMISFPRACELVPTAESYCLSAGAGFANSLRLLARLRPTALVSVPSIIEKTLDAARQSHSPMPDTIRRVIYIGEGMDAALRTRIRETLNAEVFSYYGSSETSALGVECPAHSGIHLFTSRTLFEIETESTRSITTTVNHSPASNRHSRESGNPRRGSPLGNPPQPDHVSPTETGRGELIVTTLAQKALPLLKYRLGDLIELRPGPCPCGLDQPRIDVLGRSEMFASILGSKIHHHAIRQSLARAGLTGPLQIFLQTRNSTETMTLRVSDQNSRLADRILPALLADHQDIEFLHDSRLLNIHLEFLPSSHLLQDRKPNKIVDLRL